MKVSDKLLIFYTLILFEYKLKNKKDRGHSSKENGLKIIKKIFTLKFLSKNTQKWFKELKFDIFTKKI